MYRENVEVVRRVYETVTATLEMPPELFEPDLVLDVTEVSSEFVAPIHELESAQQALREYWQTFEAFHVEIEELIHADGQQVVDVVRDGGQIKRSGTQEPLLPRLDPPRWQDRSPLHIQPPGSSPRRRWAARVGDAGITNAVLYDHFESKGALHAEVVTRANDDLLAPPRSSAPIATMVARPGFPFFRIGGA